MNEPYRLRYTNQIVGIFLLVFLMAMIGIGVVLLRTKDFFSDPAGYYLQVDQDAVEDLQTGSEVLILGQRAGQVRSIRYVDDTDDVRVDLMIDRDQADLVFTDSEVRVDRKFGVGVPVLVLRRNLVDGQPSERLPAGSRLMNFVGEDDQIEKIQREVAAVSDSVREIQRKMEPALDNVATAADRVTQSFADSIVPATDSFRTTNDQLRPEASETLRTIQAATRKMENRLAELTTRIEQLVDQDVVQTLNSVQTSTQTVSSAAQDINQTSKDVSQDVTETLATLRRATEQFQQLALETRDLVRVVRKEADQLPGTTQRVNETVGDTQDLVGEIRSHWLLRRVAQPPAPTSQVSPSSVRGSNR